MKDYHHSSANHMIITCSMADLRTDTSPRGCGVSQHHARHVSHTHSTRLTSEPTLHACHAWLVGQIRLRGGKLGECRGGKGGGLGECRGGKGAGLQGAHLTHKLRGECAQLLPNLRVQGG